MTREDAIAYGKRVIDLGLNDETQAFCELAIKALEQEPCEDTISRQAVLDIDFEKIILTTARPAEMIEQKIRALPPVTPPTKIGKWEKYGIPRCGEQHYRCTACDNYINFGVYSDYYLKEFKYCPICGARMIESQESEV